MSYAGAQFGQANYVDATVILVGLAAISGLVYWRKEVLLGILD